MSHTIKPGVATGGMVQEIFKLAKAKNFALPAVNVVGSNTINTVLETAKVQMNPIHLFNLLKFRLFLFITFYFFSIYFKIKINLLKNKNLNDNIVKYIS